jgi:ABC-2 type transport system permease protein
MMNVLVATIKRNNRIIKRAFPWSFIFGRFVGASYTALFSYFTYHFLFRHQISGRFLAYTGNADYFTYSILGAALQLFAVAVLMNVGRSLMTEVREGTFDNLILSPASRRQYLLGNLIEQSFRATLEMSVLIFGGVILGAEFTNINILQIILVWIISLVCLFSMSVALSSIMLYLRDTYLTQNTLFLTMNFLCGVTFPIKYLPEWLQYVSHLIPFTATLQLLRNVVLVGKPIWSQTDLLLEIFGLSIAYLFVGFGWIYKSEKIFIEKSFG